MSAPPAKLRAIVMPAGAAADDAEVALDGAGVVELAGVAQHAGPGLLVPVGVRLVSSSRADHYTRGG